MAWPPTIPPNTRTNETPELANHPADHNMISDALAEIVTSVENLIVNSTLTNVAAVTATNDDSVLSFDLVDPGNTPETSVRISEDGNITAHNFTAQLRTGHFYGNDPEYLYEPGDPFFRITDYGNILGGTNPWVGENADGSPRQKNRDGTLGGTPPFQHNFIVDQHADTVYLGRRWVVGDTNDPVDAIIQRADGPLSVVSGGSLGSPYVMGWNPIDVPVTTLGTSAALSAWGTRGDAGLHRQRTFDPADVFENRQPNNFSFSGLSFGSPHKLTGCVGERYTVLQAVTLNTTTPQDVIIAWHSFHAESKGRLIKQGGTVTITKQNVGSTTFSGERAKKFTGCLASSGTISLSPGDFIYSYFRFGDAENLRPKMAPQPHSALPGENPSWWSNTQIGSGLGRIAWRGLVIPPGGVNGADIATAWSPYVASMGADASENLFAGTASGRIWFRTNPPGGSGNLIRVTIEPLGQMQLLGGLSLGGSRDLTMGPNLNNPTPTLGQTGQFSYTNVSPLQYDIVIGAGMSIVVTTTVAGSATANEVQTFAISGGVAGDQYTIRFNGETSEPVAYDADLTAPHNAAAAAVFREALESLPSVEPGDVSVSRSLPGGVPTFTVTFGLTLVTSGSRFKINNTAATTITSFGVANDRAIDGQVFIFRTTNSNTTIKHNDAAVGRIWLKGKVNLPMVMHDVLMVIYDAEFGGFFQL